MTDAEIAAMIPKQLAEEGIAPEVALAARMAYRRDGWAVTQHEYDLGAVQAYADALAILRASQNRAAS